MNVPNFDTKKIRVKKWFLYPQVIMVSILMMNYGYVSFVVNPLIETFTVKNGWDPKTKAFYIGLLTSCTYLGSLFGTIIAKFVIGIGRLKSLFIANLIILLGSALTLVDIVPVIVVGRFIQGIAGLGFAMVIIPKYLYEISPVHLRGKLGLLT